MKEVLYTDFLTIGGITGVVQQTCALIYQPAVRKPPSERDRMHMLQPALVPDFSIWAKTVLTHVCIVSPRICVWMMWRWIRFPPGVNCATRLTLSPRHSALPTQDLVNSRRSARLVCSSPSLLYSLQHFAKMTNCQIRTEQRRGLETSVKRRERFSKIKFCILFL